MVSYSDLHAFIYLVREGLSELPDDLASDEQIYKDLKLAHSYINSIISSTFAADSDNERFWQDTVVALATYFSYVNYTSLAEREFGDVPITAQIRATLLRQIALAFIRQLTDLPIGDNLSVDETLMMKQFGVAASLTKNVWES